MNKEVASKGGVRWRSRPGCMFALGVGATLLVGLGVLVVSVTNSLSNSNKAVTPIPIPANSCAYLRRVHDAAAEAGRGWLDVIVDNDPKRWHDFAAQVSPKLTRFDGSLRVAVPRVPAPVADKLQEVLRQVDVGRVELPHARTGSEYTNSTGYAVAEGYFSLSDASDLVGNACGFTLAPPMDVAFPTTPPR